mmetsp:Transcript_45646/g.120731  ORF Transcript_45646/g.120731 Transcript_45646/m.120731 type:complete len:406 (-) Transcript_45646:79-1296(-)
MTFYYDTGAPLISVALTYSHTIVQTCFGKLEFWVLIFANVFTTVLFRTGYIDQDNPYIQLPWGIMKIATGLLTFFIVFYTNHCFARYAELYQIARSLMGNVHEISSELMLRLPGAVQRRKAIKYIFAGVALFFYELTMSEEDSHKTWRELDQLRIANTLTDREVQFIFQFPGPKSFLVLHWSADIIRRELGPAKERYLKTFSDKIYKIRRCSQDIADTLDLPMPFQYYHILNLMLSVNLSFWSFGMGCLDSDFAPIIFFVTTLIFMGMRELSGAISNPFGQDEVDFPTNDWLKVMYNDCVSFMEHQFELFDDEAAFDFPMQHLKDDHDLDILVDQAPRHPEDPRLTGGEAGSLLACIAACGDIPRGESQVIHAGPAQAKIDTRDDELFDDAELDGEDEDDDDDDE